MEDHPGAGPVCGGPSDLHKGDAEPSAPVLAAGQWALTDHWRGPVVLIVGATAKRVTIDDHGRRGFIEPKDVWATFATKEDAGAGMARYRASLSASQPEVARFAAVAREAREALDAVKHRVRREAREAARKAASQTAEGASAAPAKPGTGAADGQLRDEQNG